MKTKLPKGIEKSDLKFNQKLDKLTKTQAEKMESLGLNRWTYSFEIWKCEEIGSTSGTWYIPTLLISKQTKSGSRRTYAVGLEDGKVYRIGHGPHVIDQQRVYVNRNNFKRLLPLLEKMSEGRASANQIRDRVSSRRAQGQVNRANGLTSWRW